MKDFVAKKCKNYEVQIQESVAMQVQNYKETCDLRLRVEQLERTNSNFDEERRAYENKIRTLLVEIRRLQGKIKEFEMSKRSLFNEVVNVKHLIDNIE